MAQVSLCWEDVAEVGSSPPLALRMMGTEAEVLFYAAGEILQIHPNRKGGQIGEEGEKKDEKDGKVEEVYSSERRK